ncbi:hypothetical protein V6N11_013764 [Hibiscus sabdariffa]|uniref:Uncharacterized protein n=1 Tax=Hibiscus sabdariffa TaxID=183260 RepID=A0ABR2PCU3_9ROSI
MDFPLVAGFVRLDLTLGFVPFGGLILRLHCMPFEIVVLPVRHCFWLILFHVLPPVLSWTFSLGWRRRPPNYFGRGLVPSSLFSGTFGTAGAIECTLSSFSRYGPLL